MSDLRKRGLSDLLLENSFTDEDCEVVVNISLDEITPDEEQPRFYLDETKIDDLSKSISELGVLQPIIVKKVLSGYKIISGERRYRASKKLGLETIPCLIKQLNPKNTLKVAIIENIQRENLNPIEESIAFQKLSTQFNLSHEEIAKQIGKSRSYITNSIGLVKLSDKSKESLLQNKISFAHARCLSKLEVSKQDYYLEKILKDNLNVRQLENLLNEKKTKTNFAKYKNKMYNKYKIKMTDNSNGITLKSDNIENIKKMLDILLGDDD